PAPRARSASARANGRCRQARQMALDPRAGLPPRADHGARGMGSMWKGLIEWGRSHGIDWLIGRKLPSTVAALGRGHTQARTNVQTIRGRDRGALYLQLCFAEVRDRVVGAGQLDAATIDAASPLLDDPNCWTQCWMITAVWVRKPRA